MFLNETVHHQATTLYAILAKGEDNYGALNQWQLEHSASDDQTAELYAHIEDAFNSKPVHTISPVNAMSMVSKCLWKARVQ